MVGKSVTLPVWIDCLGTRYNGGDPILLAKRSVLAVRIAGVGIHCHRIGAYGLLALHRHRMELLLVVALIGHSKATISLCSASTAICAL